jgi:hypothetical protein
MHGHSLSLNFCHAAILHILQQQYVASSNRAKMAITSIIDEIHRQGGRFLKWSNSCRGLKIISNPKKLQVEVARTLASIVGSNQVEAGHKKLKTNPRSNAPTLLQEAGVLERDSQNFFDDLQRGSESMGEFDKHIFDEENDLSIDAVPSEIVFSATMSSNTNFVDPLVMEKASEAEFRCPTPGRLRAASPDTPGYTLSSGGNSCGRDEFVSTSQCTSQDPPPEEYLPDPDHRSTPGRLDPYCQEESPPRSNQERNRNRATCSNVKQVAIGRTIGETRSMAPSDAPQTDETAFTVPKHGNGIAPSFRPAAMDASMLNQRILWMLWCLENDK